MTKPRTCFLLLVLALFCTATVNGQSDTEPPKLLSLSFSPSTVDVTSGPQVVTVQMHLTDNLAGIDTTSGRGVGISLLSPSGIQTASGAPPAQPGVILDAVLTINVTVPQYVEPGTWKVGILRLADNVGNTAFLTFDVLSAAGFPASIQVIDATPDTQAPQLSSVTFSPAAVNVSSSDAAITVDLALTDNLAGVGWSGITAQDFILLSPSGNQTQLISVLQLVRISGTPTNGIWRGNINMPRYSEPGTWRLTSLRLQDVVRNNRVYDASDLAGLGPSTEVSVSSSPSDTTPPQVIGMSFNPSFVNTSVGPQTIVVEMTATDNLSGVSFRSDTRNSSLIYGTTFSSPSGAQFRNTNSVNFLGETAPISGTSTNGTWRFNVTLPQFSEEGTWTAASLLKDRTRNTVAYSSVDLLARGLPNQLVVIRPSLQIDGSISDPAAGGTVSDSTFGTRASLIIPPGVLSQPTSIAIDVLQSPLGLPLPTGFSTAETPFVNIKLTPEPIYPLPAPGITVVVPLRNYQIPGTALNLFYVDSATGVLLPYLDASGQPLTGLVDPGGLTATFYGVDHFSTIVGLLPNAITVDIDIKPGDLPNAINPDSKGTVPVAVMSSPAFDATTIDWETLRFSGAGVVQQKKGKWQVSIADVNGDGRNDIVARFQTNELLLSPADTQGVVEGQTSDGRRFRGTDSVKIVK